MMIDDLAEMVSDGDKETLDRCLFASLPSIRSQYYVRNGELYVSADNPAAAPVLTYTTPGRVLTYHPAPVRRS